VSLFVVGTEAGVGKTLVAAVLLARYRERVPLVYWKPVDTGTGARRDRDTIDSLVPGADSAAEAYLFEESLPPLLAAERTGETIELARITARWRELRATLVGREFVLEGTGRPLEPLDSEGNTAIDLVAATMLPALLVARSSAGAVGQARLALEALDARGVEVAGIVLSGPEDVEGAAAIARLGGAEVIGRVPPLGSPTAAVVAAAARELDPGGRLASWLAPN